MAEKEPKQLLKLLGVGFGIAVTVGGTIGTGILRKPGPVAAELQDPWLIMGVWVAISLYAFLGVLCAIELGVAIPKAGAWYVYARRAFGEFVGFFTGITSWLGTVTSLGFGAYTISEYLGLLFPEVNNWLRLCSVAILLTLMAFHMLGTKLGGRSQEIVSAIKALALVLFVGFCFVHGEAAWSVQEQAHVAKSGLWLGIIGAMQAVFYTFDGWHTAAYFAEENTDSTKNLPKAMIGGVFTIIVIYLLVNLAILYVLPMDQLMESKLAAADAVTLLAGKQAGKWVTIFLLISILGLMNAQVMFAPRVIYSMGRDGLFFKGMMQINKFGTPAIGLITTVLLSVLLVISGKETSGRLSDIATFFFVMSYTMGFASLIRLRNAEPELERPFKVPLYPFLPWFMLVCSSLFLMGTVWGDWKNSKFAIAFLCITYPLYLLLKAKQSKS
ncbi:amino acid permease [Marinilongibacter aquaticus]|uniref:APC family permease n=1 Tax=Marinilongibacter aquaticus TaxID=2975157 RepID=UPI0021BD9883|nr:amino acid permease [Marinilongibacter aquaticus]UBM57450.1 amino acid permease [Marinilongibacter aquaticus]